MALETDLYSFLTGQSPALCGNRIYPHKLPEKNLSLPAITYMRAGTFTDQALDGPSGDQRPRIQFDVWAERYLEGQAVADQLESLLDGFRGMMGERLVRTVMLENRFDLYEDAARYERVVLEFIFGYGG